MSIVKPIAVIVAFVLFQGAVLATSYRPLPAPKVSCQEAITAATNYAQEKNEHYKTSYIDRVWFGTDPITLKDCWVISWADRGHGWFFAIVSMDGVAGEPPEGSILRIRPDYDGSLRAKRNQAEQGGAGKSATRSESDSEGGDTPQPESEGRSR